MERLNLELQPDAFDSKKVNLAARAAAVYFDPKPWESEAMYEAVGIRHFQKVLRVLPNYRSFGNSKRSMKLLSGLGMYSEAVHAACFAYLANSQMNHAKSSDWENFVISSAVNVIANVYPVMSQRYNRIRLRRVIDKMEKKEIRKADNKE